MVTINKTSDFLDVGTIQIIRPEVKPPAFEQTIQAVSIIKGSSIQVKLPKVVFEDSTHQPFISVLNQEQLPDYFQINLN